MSLSVVCFKWHQEGFRNKYSAAHVNRLAEMVKRNTTVDYEFICVTDDAIGLREDIKVIPLWANPMPSYGGLKRPNCFARLKIFSDEVKALFGERVLWLDLDCLILGNIDHIMREKADFRIWRVDGEISLCNGSLVSHRLGTRTDLWTKFEPKKVDPEDGYRNTTGHVGSDQAWIAQNLQNGDQLFGKVDGVYSYRCHLKGKPLPPDTKIVFFHGDDKAEDLLKVGWIRRVLEEYHTEVIPRERKNIPRDKLRVVTYLWHPPKGQKPIFGADQVNTLQSMLDRHYRKPYELVCITDCPKGIDSGVRIIPGTDEFKQLPHPQLGEGVSTCYRRLRMFSEEMADVIAPRFAQMDLDVCIIKDIAPILDRKEEFVGWDTGFDWAPYNGSLTLMSAGARAKVWKQFHPERTPLAAREAGFIGTDQAVVAHLLGRGEATWTEADGVYAFRSLGYTGERERDRNRKLKEDRKRRERNRERDERDAKQDARRAARKALPDNCRIVFFPGPIKPWQPAAFEGFHWIRKSYREKTDE